MGLQNKNKLFLDSFCNSIYKSNFHFKNNPVLKNSYQFNNFKYKNLKFIFKIFGSKSNKNTYLKKNKDNYLNILSFSKPLKFYKRDKILIIKKFFKFHSKKTAFFSRIFDFEKQSLRAKRSFFAKRIFFAASQQKRQNTKKKQLEISDICLKSKISSFTHESKILRKTSFLCCFAAKEAEKQRFTSKQKKVQLNFYTLKKKSFFNSKIKGYNKPIKNRILNFNIYEKYKLIFFTFFLKNFNFIKFLVNNNNDCLFKIIQLIPIFKSSQMNDFKVYLKYETFFSLKSHFNINPLYFKPSFLLFESEIQTGLNKKNSNFFFLNKIKNKIFYFINKREQKNFNNFKSPLRKTKFCEETLFYCAEISDKEQKKVFDNQKNFCKFRYLFYKIKYLEFLLKNQKRNESLNLRFKPKVKDFNIFCQKIKYYMVKLNNFKFLLLNPFLSNLYNKNWKIFKNLKKDKFTVKFQKMYFIIEMIFFLGKKIFYKKKKKISFQIQKFLWNNFIFKNESFIYLCSIIFEHKYNDLLLKKNHILFLNFNKFLVVFCAKLRFACKLCFYRKKWPFFLKSASQTFGLKLNRRFNFKLSFASSLAASSLSNAKQKRSSERRPNQIKSKINNVYLQKKIQNFCKHKDNRGKISSCSRREQPKERHFYIRQQHPEIEIILATIKFALSFELNYKISSYNKFKFFIKKSNYTIKNNDIIYHYFNFLFKTNFIKKNYLATEFLNKKNILFDLKSKKYFCSNNSNFLYILNKLIKISKLNPKYFYNLTMYKNIYRKSFFKLKSSILTSRANLRFAQKNNVYSSQNDVLRENEVLRRGSLKLNRRFYLKPKERKIQNFFYTRQNCLKQNLKLIIQHIYFDGLGLKKNTYRKISNYKMIFLILDVNKMKKRLKNTRLYYNTFLVNFNIKYNLSFYNKVLNFCNKKHLSFFNDKIKDKFILKNEYQMTNNSKSIFFIYKKFLIHNIFLLYNFKSFFFNAYFFLIYKTEKIVQIQNQSKFFFIKKWDPLKQKMFLFVLETIWRNVKTSFYLSNLYQNFSTIFFNNQFHKILVIEKANLFLINNKHIFINQFISFFILWIKKKSFFSKKFIFLRSFAAQQRMKSKISRKTLFFHKKEVIKQKHHFFSNEIKSNGCKKNKKLLNFHFNIKGFVLFVIQKPKKNIKKFSYLNGHLLYFKSLKKYEKREWIVFKIFKKSSIFFNKTTLIKLIQCIQKTKFFFLFAASKQRFSARNFVSRRKQSFLLTPFFEYIVYLEIEDFKEQIQNKIQFSSYPYSQNENSIFLIPSKRALKIYLKKLKQIISKSTMLNKRKMINELNLIIINWCFYNRIVNDFHILNYNNKILFKLIWKWCCQKHPNKSKEWIQKKYFFCLTNKKWIFGGIPENFDSEKSIKRIYYLLSFG